MARKKVERDLEPVVSVSLKYKQVLETVSRVAKQKGMNYITPLKNGERPFLKDNGTPNCLIGATLIELGAHIPIEFNFSSVRRLRREGIVDCTDKTIELLTIIQDCQDDGYSWGESVIIGECTMLERLLPWSIRADRQHEKRGAA